MIKKISLLLMLISLTACGTVQKAQYSALESVGIHKRDVLVSRIETTTQAQETTKEDMRSAYEKFTALVAVDNGDLEKKYKVLSKAVERSEESAANLDDRIEAVNKVSKALFKEWRKELDEYSSASLRAKSEKNLSTTQQKYDRIYAKMQESQRSITPVLQILQDNTLFLKHNLNARAVNGLQTEVASIENKVSELIRQMEASIDESQSFIRSMQGS